MLKAGGNQSLKRILEYNKLSTKSLKILHGSLQLSGFKHEAYIVHPHNTKSLHRSRYLGPSPAYVYIIY